MIAEFGLVLLAMAVPILLVGLLRRIPPHGRVILIGPSFNRPNAYQLLIQGDAGTMNIMFSQDELLRVAGVVVASAPYHRQFVWPGTQPTAVVPAWALPEVRQQIAAAAGRTK